MSRKRQEQLESLLAAGDQSAYERELEATRQRRNRRLDRMDQAARRAAEADVEDLADRACGNGFDPDLDLE